VVLVDSFNSSKEMALVPVVGMQGLKFSTFYRARRYSIIFNY